MVAKKTDLAAALKELRRVIKHLQRQITKSD